MSFFGGIVILENKLSVEKRKAHSCMITKAHKLYATIVGW